MSRPTCISPLDRHCLKEAPQAPPPTLRSLKKCMSLVLLPPHQRGPQKNRRHCAIFRETFFGMGSRNPMLAASGKTRRKPFFLQHWITGARRLKFWFSLNIVRFLTPRFFWCRGTDFFGLAQNTKKIVEKWQKKVSLNIVQCRRAAVPFCEKTNFCGWGRTCGPNFVHGAIYCFYAIVVLHAILLSYMLIFS